MGKDVEVLSMENKYEAALRFIFSNVMMPRKFGKQDWFDVCLVTVHEATFKAELYDKYKDLIDMIETLNLDIDSVINLIHIHAADSIDQKDNTKIDLINKLFEEEKVKGYDR